VLSCNGSPRHQSIHIRGTPHREQQFLWSDPSGKQPHLVIRSEINPFIYTNKIYRQANSNRFCSRQRGLSINCFRACINIYLCFVYRRFSFAQCLLWCDSLHGKARPYLYSKVTFLALKLLFFSKVTYALPLYQVLISRGILDLLN